MTPEIRNLAEELLALAGKATRGPYRSMRDGNQYIDTRYMPTCKLVGASIVEGLVRPWNPHAMLSFGLKASEHEVVRFKDADADYIAACSPDAIAKLACEVLGQGQETVERRQFPSAPGCYGSDLNRRMTDTLADFLQDQYYHHTKNFDELAAAVAKRYGRQPLPAPPGKEGE